MAVILFEIVLFLLGLAAAAAGFVNSQYALAWWILAGVVATATVAVSW